MALSRPSPRPLAHYGVGFMSQVSSPAHSEGQATLAAAWDGADFQPQLQGGSREHAGSLRSGQQEPLSQKREHRPFPKHGEPQHAQGRAPQCTLSVSEAFLSRVGALRSLHAISSLCLSVLPWGDGGACSELTMNNLKTICKGKQDTYSEKLTRMVSQKWHMREVHKGTL